MTLEIERFSSTDAAALALARAVAAELTAALAQRPRALLLVSGGRSPLVFFEALRLQPIDWQRIDVSLVDERCVAADDDAANASLVRAHLLHGAAARWIGLLPEAEALVGATPLERAQDAAGRANHDPLLAHAAVVVLGVGSDGHTASLFADAPQWALAQVTSERYVALQPGAAPHARISLSLPALRQQGSCHVWATGTEKLQVLTRLQEHIARHAGPVEKPMPPLSGTPSGAQPGARSNQPPPAWLAAAGPMACLIADPALVLTAYCTIDQAP